jgi:hypothetical protein
MKFAYALLITSGNLSHYFQAHQIEVHTSSTLGEALHNREATGTIAKWAIKLTIYVLTFLMQLRKHTELSMLHFTGGILQVSYLLNPMGSSNSIMSKMYTGITLVGTINPNGGYVK